MPLRETAQTIQPKRSGFSCGIEKALYRLDAEDGEWLIQQLANEEVTAQWISDVLRAEKHDVSQSVVARHRSGRCRCGSV